MRAHPDVSLAGRHAVVTGSGRGIGAQTARELASLGASISLLDLDLDRAEGVAAELERNGHEARAFPCDIAEAAAVESAFAAVADASSPPDILVNNAGITSFVPFLETTEADWDALVGINLTGTFLCTQAALPSMRERGWGRIVNISSIAGKRGGGFLGRTPYSAAKAGVLGFTKALAREVADDGVTVNAIAPGPMDTDMTQILREDAELLGRIVANVPLQRRGLPYEIADAVCVLCTGLGSYMTGETINVDGGVAME
ncbi:MAG: SDR family NAD(P)-dependent oxidoreductase [Gaiellaceae bacterium]